MAASYLSPNQSMVPGVSADVAEGCDLILGAVGNRAIRPKHQRANLLFRYGKNLPTPRQNRRTGEGRASGPLVRSR